MTLPDQGSKSRFSMRPTRILSSKRIHPDAKRASQLDGDGKYITVTIDCGIGQSVNAKIAHDGAVQHTISWDEEIRLPVLVDDKPAVLKPGSANLYKYPKVFFNHLRKGKAIVPAVESLYVLELLLRACILDEDENSSLAPRRDVTGATPLHGLLLSNTRQSLSLALGIYRANPRLLLQAHTLKVFTGENALHVLAVNRREEELCECVQLAAESFTRQQLQQLFTQQATGVFFSAEPMAYYGGTAVSYAVAFSLPEALRTMLRCSKFYPEMHGVLDFNDPAKYACKLTGLLPLHVAVANSLTSMYNFLVDLPGLPLIFDDMRAQHDALSTYGVRTKLSLLLPLQVAAKLGDRKLVQYILRSKSKKQWEWGPVSSYTLDLKGIDSIGEGGNDVMELCAHLDALPETKDMLLDDFMAGLMHTLFEEKFRERGLKWMHYLSVSIDSIYLLSMYVLAVCMVNEPNLALHAGVTSLFFYLPYVTMASIVPLVEEELRLMLRKWYNTRTEPKDEETTKLNMEGGLRGHAVLAWRDFSMLLRWMRSHHSIFKILSWSFAILASLMLLTVRAMPVDDDSWDPSITTPRDRTDIILLPLSLVRHTEASFFYSLYYFRNFLVQYEGLAILYQVIFEILGTDVTRWLLLFCIILLNYGMVMYTTYPRFIPDALTGLHEVMASPEVSWSSNDIVEPAPAFLHFQSSLLSLVELALVGEGLQFDVLGGVRAIEANSDPTTGRLSMRGVFKLILFINFTVFYLLYILLALVLLLNLLIAMMGDTFARARTDATRWFRVNYARHVLRLELQLMFLHRLGLVNLNCGTQSEDPTASPCLDLCCAALSSARRSLCRAGTLSEDGSTYVIEYRNYHPNAEGGGTRGAPASMFEAEVEREVENDEMDDDGPGAGDAEQAPLSPRAASRRVRQDSLAPEEGTPAAAAQSPRGKTMHHIGRKLVTVTTAVNGMKDAVAQAKAVASPPPPASPPATDDFSDLAPLAAALTPRDNVVVGHATVPAGAEVDALLEEIGGVPTSAPPPPPPVVVPSYARPISRDVA